VTVGANSECALDAHGEIECWAGPDAETSLPRGPFRQIALFDADMGGCGLHAAGDIVCWLSDLTPDDGQYLAIAVEDRSLCAIDIDGALHCWGDDISSPPAGTFMQVAMAGSYACALDDAGAIQCWSDRELDPHLYPPDSLCVEPASGPW
jgi:hypothetical protein